MKLQQQVGYTLIEVLVSGLILSLVLTGVTGAWKIMDYQFLTSRLQGRASRVIRQVNDYILYAPYDSLPADGAQLKGFLFQPYDRTSQSFKQELPYTVTASVTAVNQGTLGETTQVQLTLHYLLPVLSGHDPTAHTIQLPPTIRPRL